MELVKTRRRDGDGRKVKGKLVEKDVPRHCEKCKGPIFAQSLDDFTKDRLHIKCGNGLRSIVL